MPESTPTTSFPAPPRADRRTRLQNSLLAWFGAAKRDLPWRRNRDAYGIWISEAMLQQTRVSTVIDYWLAFMQSFPTVQDLAQASEEQVLARWSGLGYYSRARALHRAAQIIVAEHGGEFPRDRKIALTLPGVGEYTAGAVLSIAYGLPEALVDGNVERVFTRVFGLRAVSGSAPLRKHTWDLAHRCLHGSSPGDWNQALMELGATVCTPGEPHCHACPWSRLCVARRRGEASAWPSPKPRRKPVELKIAGLWVEYKGSLLLSRRPTKGSMAGMWELPTQQSQCPGASSLWLGAWAPGLGAAGQESLFEAKHAITHHRIEMTVLKGKVTRKALSSNPSTLRWFAWGQLENQPLTGLTRKALAHLAP